jgi:hypothetical protein
VPGIGLKECRVVDHNLENEDLNVDVRLGPPDLLVQGLHKEGHHTCVLVPLRLEELQHLIDATLDVPHAFVLIHIVQLQLILCFGLLIWQRVVAILLFLLFVDQPVQLHLFLSSLPGSIRHLRLAFEYHSRIELFVGTHKGGVDILIDQVMSTKLCDVPLAHVLTQL